MKIKSVCFVLSYYSKKHCFSLDFEGILMKEIHVYLKYHTRKGSGLNITNWSRVGIYKSMYKLLTIRIGVGVVYYQRDEVF